MMVWMLSKDMASAIICMIFRTNDETAHLQNEGWQTMDDPL